MEFTQVENEKEPALNSNDSDKSTLDLPNGTTLKHDENGFHCSGGLIWFESTDKNRLTFYHPRDELIWVLSQTTKDEMLNCKS